MYIFINALKNIGRNIGRNILLAFILLAIIGTTVVTLTITNTADSIIDTHQEQFGSQVIIQPDIDAIMAEIEQGVQQGDGERGLAIPRLTIEEALTLADSDYVQNYHLTVAKMAAGYGITTLGEEEMDEMMSGMGGGFMIMGGGGQITDENTDFVMPNLNFIGGEWAAEFESGERVLHEGEFPQATGEAIISFDLAELNNLTIGDTLIIQGSLFSEDNDATNLDYRVTITGIYMDFTPNASPGMLGFTPPTMDRRNEVLTSIDTIVTPIDDQLENAITLQVDATYYLQNPEYLDAFEAAARTMGVSEMLLFSSNTAEFNAMVAPVEGLRSIAQTFLIVVLVLGSLILILLSSIFIRERKYEIGVLRAMGMKRQKVAMGLWSEMLILTATCLVLGLGIGTIVAQPVSDKLLAAQMEATAVIPETSNTGGFHMIGGGGRGGLNFGGQQESEYNPIDQLNLSLDPSTLLQITGISFALMTITAVTGAAKITKYEPIKILMERD